MPRRCGAWVLTALTIVGVIVVAAALWASSDPDGLESIAQQFGFMSTAQQSGYNVLPDYTVPGLSGTGSTIVAGLIGVGILFVVVFVVGRLLARRTRGGS